LERERRRRLGLCCVMERIVERSHDEPEQQQQQPPAPQSPGKEVLEEEDHGKLMDWLLMNKEDSGGMEDYTRDELNFTDLLDFDQQTDQPHNVNNDDSGRYSFTHEDYFSNHHQQQQQAGGEIPDFNDTSNRSMSALDSPPEAEEDLGKNLKLKFREYSRPVPASYYRSYSYNCASGDAYARKDHAMVDQANCFDQSSPNQSSMISTQEDLDQMMRGPPPPSRSLSCPAESQDYRGDPLVYDANVMPFHSMRGMPPMPPSHHGSSSREMPPPQYHMDHPSMMLPPYEMYHNHRQQPLQVYDESIHQSHQSQRVTGSGPYQNIAHTIKMKSQQHLNGVIHTGTVISRAPAAASGAGGRQKGKKSSASSSSSPLQRAKLNSQNKKGVTKTSSSSATTTEKKTASKRSSKYRGVTKHRRSGRWEAHIWVRETGKQVYLGGYELEEHAAEAYDVAALKCKGSKVKTNFEVSKYTELLQYMSTISLEELVMAVRRQSQGFARGSSKYRGVTRHPNGRWEARIGMPGSRHIYLGLFNDESDAAKAYDRALVKLRGSQAATNFALSNYKEQLKEYHMKQQKEILTKSSQQQQNPSSATKVESESNGETTFLNMKPFHMQPGSHHPPATATIADHATRHI
jgi:hypothetical protein